MTDEEHYSSKRDSDSLRHKWLKLKELEYSKLELDYFNIVKSNEQMLEYVSSDYDLIQYREDNLKFLAGILKQMHKIKKDIEFIDPSHFIVSKEIPPREVNPNQTTKKKYNVEIKDVTQKYIENKNEPDEAKEFKDLNNEGFITEIDL